jgi:hypothetical protein
MRDLNTVVNRNLREAHLSRAVHHVLVWYLQYLFQQDKQSVSGFIRSSGWNGAGPT